MIYIYIYILYIYIHVCTVSSKYLWDKRDVANLVRASTAGWSSLIQFTHFNIVTYEFPRAIESYSFRHKRDCFCRDLRPGDQCGYLHLKRLCEITIKVILADLV